ncbi:class I SAM-dependent RNA methyltransferase [Rhizobium sp. YIM 134829]|uniref:class I SAM-dependent RNA methyltransferase n=1 Tax=Rhizobium sp. YIM 134829 TaxID=3390453 RepID=UPI00397E567A
MSALTARIDRLGPQGDGVVASAEGPVYVPFTLPGEQATLAVSKQRGTVMALLEASPERVQPPCRHFGPHGENGTCGGCSLQHASDPLYHDFKRRLVVDALAQRGIETEVAPLVIARPGERRRVTMTARRTEKAMLLGYNQAESHHIVSVVECSIASPGIVSRLGALRRIAAALSSDAEPFRITILETAVGLDLAVDGLKPLSERHRRHVVDTVLGVPGIARLAVAGEVLVEPTRPVLDFGGVPVTPPPGGFAQASSVAEAAMADLVMAGLGGAKRVADLFAGSGTFSLRIARQARVHAVEGEERALQALDAAARAVQGLKPVTVEKRDLFRRPMMVSELKAFDAVVFDPPRAGAEAQSTELARSAVPIIVAVSCNPVTLARDLALLTSGGYRVTGVTPIDQFLWSSHVEAVATLVRD